MIIRTSDIILPELEEPICCTKSFSDGDSDKKHTEIWQGRQEIEDPHKVKEGDQIVAMIGEDRIARSALRT